MTFSCRILVVGRSSGDKVDHIGRTEVAKPGAVTHAAFSALAIPPSPLGCATRHSLLLNFSFFHK
jgi:hypothetical protein